MKAHEGPKSHTFQMTEHQKHLISRFSPWIAMLGRQVRLQVGAASSASLTKLLTLSHAWRQRSGHGLILHLAAHGDEDRPLTPQKSHSFWMLLDHVANWVWESWIVLGCFGLVYCVFRPLFPIVGKLGTYQAGGLILESTKGTGEAHPCTHEARHATGRPK